MKFVVRMFSTALAIILLVAFSTAQVPQMSPFSADLQISSTAEHAPQDMAGKIFVGGGHMRMNMSAAGRETAIITTFATKTVDILMPQQQMYVEFKADQAQGRSPAAGTQDLKPIDPNNPCANQSDVTCKKIGTEEINGRTCDHWQITDKNGRTSNVWIDQKLRFPIKVVTDNSTMTLSNIKEGEPDASLFQIPSGFHKMDVGAMMPQGMGRPPQN